MVSDRLESIAQLITLVLIFAFVVGLTYFATRLVGNVQKERQAGSNIKVLETMRISNTKYIQVVKIGSKCFAIAVCKDTVTYLCELKEEELFYSDATSQMGTDSFKAILDKFKKDKPED
ncbi:MAG: flagellar biosynthetic protein FliO [Lachnospira sp.]|nr:flagellar biosynthetic protein FliO [Lachnospira sp.]